MAMTSSGLFFAGRPTRGPAGVFALSNQDVTAGCSSDDRCVRRVAKVGNPSSLCWDGDATLYVAEKGRAVVALPSATASRHEVAPGRDIQKHAMPMTCYLII